MLYFIRKFIIVGVFAFISAINVYSQNVFLLSVGVSDYPGTENDLLLPKADANSIVELYKSNSAATIKLLVDKDATKSAIIKSAGDLFSKAKKNDIVVFYFSGHGSSTGFYAYDKLLTYDDIKIIFSACDSKHKMIFADACHSGKLRDKSLSTNSPSSKADVLLFLSSRHDESSIEKRGMKNGFFTSCLIKCLKGAADENTDRIITAKELFDGVSKGVILMSNNQQHPVMWGSFDDNMTVMKW